MTRSWLYGLAVAAVSAFLALPGGASATSATCTAEGSVTFICGDTAAEDLLPLPGTRWIIASAYTGTGGVRLIDRHDKSITPLSYQTGIRDAWDRKTYGACPGAPSGDDRAKFITHGLALGARQGTRRTVYAVHHGTRETVEVLTLNLAGKIPSLTWIGCVVAPEGVGLNSIVGLREGGFIATNFLPRGGDPAEAFRKMTAGENNGELWEWHPGTGWAKIAGTAGSGLNGVEISADGKTLYVAAWGSQSFMRIVRDGSSPPQSVALGFRADNVRWSPDGMLLIAGQTEKGSKVLSIDPGSLKLTELIDHADTAAFGKGTGAIRVGDEIWLGSYVFPRIGVFSANRVVSR